MATPYVEAAPTMHALNVAMRVMVQDIAESDATALRSPQAAGSLLRRIQSNIRSDRVAQAAGAPVPPQTFAEIARHEEDVAHTLLFEDDMDGEVLGAGRDGPRSSMSRHYALATLQFCFMFSGVSEHSPIPIPVELRWSRLAIGCMYTLHVTAADVAKRMYAYKTVSARESMRILFSNASILLFRDCPRGSTRTFSGRDADGEESVVVHNPPYTRLDIRGASEDADAIMVSRNAWLRCAWSVFVQLAHAREKRRDIPIETAPEEVRGQLADQEITRPDVEAFIGALKRRMQSAALFRVHNESRGRSRAVYAANIRQTVSMIGAYTMALACDIMHEAMRSVELAGEPESHFLSDPHEQRLFYHTRSDRDPERCAWWWPLWRGDADRSKARIEDLVGRNPYPKIYAEDARHTHSIRGTRTAGIALPKRHWRTHDAQDSAAATLAESELGRRMIALSNALAEVHATAGDARLDEVALARVTRAAKQRADALSGELSRAFASIQQMETERTAPDYHSRAMADAAISEWPGDNLWIQQTPSDPRSVYAPLEQGGDGGIDLGRAGGEPGRQTSHCVELDMLRSDVRMAQALLRSAEHVVAVKYGNARTPATGGTRRATVDDADDPESRLVAIGRADIGDRVEAPPDPEGEAAVPVPSVEDSIPESIPSPQRPPPDAAESEFSAPPGATSTDVAPPSSSSSGGVGMPFSASSSFRSPAASSSSAR